MIRRLLSWNLLLGMIQTPSPGGKKMAFFHLELFQLGFEIAESLTAGFVIPA